VSPKAGLDAVVKRKIPSPCRDWNPPIIQPVVRNEYFYIDDEVLRHSKAFSIMIRSKIQVFKREQNLMNRRCMNRMRTETLKGTETRVFQLHIFRYLGQRLW
jgi:hypothetical protein